MKLGNLKVEVVSLNKIQSYVNNPKEHPADQIKQIASSIRNFGFNDPIAIDDKYEIIEGHGRYLAAKLLKLKTVPVIFLRHLSKGEKKAYSLAHNKLTMNTGFNIDFLRIEFEMLTEMKNMGDLNFDLDEIGFDQNEINELLGITEEKKGLTDDDEVPGPPKKPITKKGDLWKLGEHLLLCGDATNEADVKRLMNDVKPHLMVTDPPYGVEYDANWRNEADRKNGKPYGASAIGKVNNDDIVDWTSAWMLFPGDVAYVWHADRHASKVQISLESADFEIRCQIIWAKARFAISRGDYHWQHEPCWYAVKKNKRGHWSGDRSQSTLWNIEHLKSDTGHSTQKPVECMLRPIINNSNIRQVVYDPFLGSGTTLIAAEKTGRKCFGIEINPSYCDVILQRWENFTGQKAERIKRDKNADV